MNGPETTQAGSKVSAGASSQNEAGRDTETTALRGVRGSMERSDGEGIQPDTAAECREEGGEHLVEKEDRFSKIEAIAEAATAYVAAEEALHQRNSLSLASKWTGEQLENNVDAAWGRLKEAVAA